MQQSVSPGAQKLVTVHRVCGVGLTEQVRGLLKTHPKRQFLMRDMLECIGPGACRMRLASVLSKLQASGEVLVSTTAVVGWSRRSGSPLPDVRQVVKAYKWRLPGDK